MSGKALLVMSESDEQTLYRVALEQAGLMVSCAATTSEAVVQCAADVGYDLLVADVLFDRRGTGRQVAEHLQRRCPSVRVLFLAGCPLGQILERDALDAATFASGRAAFLRTPLPTAVLMSKVWRLLDGAAVSLTPTVTVEGRAEAPAAAMREAPIAVQPTRTATRKHGPTARMSAGAA